MRKFQIEGALNFSRLQVFLIMKFVQAEPLLQTAPLDKNLGLSFTTYL